MNNMPIKRIILGRTLIFSNPYVLRSDDQIAVGALRVAIKL